MSIVNNINNPVPSSVLGPFENPAGIIMSEEGPLMADLSAPPPEKTVVEAEVEKNQQLLSQKFHFEIGSQSSQKRQNHHSEIASKMSRVPLKDDHHSEIVSKMRNLSLKKDHHSEILAKLSKLSLRV